MSKTTLSDEEKEELKPFEEAMDFSRPDFSFIPDIAQCEWSQRGPFLQCGIDGMIFTVGIGNGKIMTGIGPGNRPILEDKKKWLAGRGKGSRN